MGLETAAIIAIGASALAAGTASVISQKSANKTNVKLQNETNALNYQMFREQLGFSERMQDKQNEYNTPANQRARFEQAGINPYLVMGNINSGNSELVTSPSPNPAQSPSVQSVSGFADMLQNLGTVPSRALEISSMSEQINAQREAVKQARIQSEFYRAEKIAGINKTLQETQNLVKSGKLTDVEVREANQRIGRMRHEIESLKLANQFNRRTMRARTKKEEKMADLVAAQEQGQLLQNAYQQLTNDAFPSLNEAQMSLLAGQTYQAVMSGEMSKEGASLNQAMTKRELTKIVGDVIDNGIKANQFKLSDFGLTSAQLQAMRDGKIIENLNQSTISNWLDNIFYYTKTTMPNVPVGFIKGLK